MRLRGNGAAVKQTWTKPNIKGHPPTPRDSHTCVTMGEKLYVFGGTDGTSPLDDLHVLDTGSHSFALRTILPEE